MQFNSAFYRVNYIEYLLMFLILTMPFFYGIANVLFVLLVVFSLKKTSFTRLVNPSFIVLFLLVLYLLTKATLTNQIIEDYKQYSLFFYILLTPIFFKKLDSLIWVKTTVVFTNVLLILINVFLIIQFYLECRYLPFNDVWVLNKVLVVERPYLGLMSVISILLSLDLLKAKCFPKYNFILLFTTLLSLFFIVFISIRISLLILIILAIVYVFGYSGLTKTLKVGFFLGVLCFIVSVFYLNDNLRNRFFIDQSLEQSINKFKDSEPRVIIWSCAYQLSQGVEFSKLFGTSSYKKNKEEMVDCYTTTIKDSFKRNAFLERKYNTHNQYLDFYLVGGIVAVLLVAGFFVWAIYLNKNNYFAIGIFITFFIMFMVENVLHRQFGTMLFSIIINLYNGKEED